MRRQVGPFKVLYDRNGLWPCFKFVTITNIRHLREGK